MFFVCIIKTPLIDYSEQLVRISSIGAIDVTPPTQAVVSTVIDNASKQIKGKSDEDGAKVFVKVNGEWLKDAANNAVTTTVAGGNWTINLPSYIDKTAQVEVYLKDTTKITPLPSYVLPSSYTVEPDGVDGNLNEDPTTYNSYVGYHDALKGTTDNRFDSATLNTVADVLPDKPMIEKTVVSSGGATTQVGDTLTYTITAKNNKEAAYTTLWANTVIKDTLPAGLDFDSTTAEVKIGGVVAETPKDYSYDSDSRLLTVKLGDLATGDSVTVTFKAKVASSAVGTVVSNTATAVGDSPRETPFVEGPNDPNAKHETYSATSKKADSPGGTVFGVLELASAPTEIDFGSVKYQGKTTRINSATHQGADLVVKDSRANKKGWSLTAKLTTPMTSTDPDVPAYTLDGALKYVYKNNEITLNGGAQDIMIQASNASTSETTYNISDTWSESGDGFKFEASAQDVKTLGTYQGEILWELGDTP